ncbi:MAG: hypothetical protein HY276_11470 [Ignavibacteriales bacterium]|nr:hypothetical protein [Ignavibacteriales bacterium]MBI3788859.1 hypothetical protein [Ignavibacteriales bacterium]
MKKVSLIGGSVFSLLFVALVIVIAMTSMTPSQAYAQDPAWSMTINMPDIDVLVITNYIGIDRKLKPVAGQSVSIIGPLTASTEVTLSAVVTGGNILGLNECNTTIATATTQKFTVRGSRNLTATDFTGSGGIGIATSDDNQKCIDALSDKVQKGVGTAPPGNYSLRLALNEVKTGRVLATASKNISITASSSAEVVLNLIAPGNGEQITQLNPTFSFDSQKEGKLFVFEHANLRQSPDEATRDLNANLKCMEYSFNTRGTGQVTYSYPGTALRPLQAGKKYSWFIQSVISVGGGKTETKRSPIYSFTVGSNDPAYTALLSALSNAPDPIGSSFSNVTSQGYTLAFSSSNSVRIRLGDGTWQNIDLVKLQSILAEITRRNLKVTASIQSE